MSLSANLEFVYLHNSRLRHLELIFHLQYNQTYTSEIVDFDEYSIIINHNNYKINVVKKDIIYIEPVKYVNIADIDYISKTYYLAQDRLKTKHNKPPIQDIFLNEVRKYRLPVELIFKDKTTFRGNIMGFDNFIILLDLNDKQSMIYKNNILVVHPLNQTLDIIKYVDERRYGT
jgi:host factor-I protein